MILSASGGLKCHNSLVVSGGLKCHNSLVAAPFMGAKNTQTKVRRHINYDLYQPAIKIMKEIVGQGFSLAYFE